MEDLKRLGKTEVLVPSIGFGTWGIGGFETPRHSLDDYYVTIIHKAIDLGLWLIDTAEYYAKGHSEELVGQAIKNYHREDVFIVTKVWYTNLRYDDIIRAANKSLKRLGTNYIDLYLVHWPNPSIPLKETMKAMELLVREGLVRFIGVSNFSVELLEEARSHLSREDIVANEVKYSILDRGIEKEALPYCQREGITVIAYTPLEKGKVAKEKVLVDVGNKYGKTAVQVALNWLISKDTVIAIPKAAKEEHIMEIAGAMGWRLSRKDIEFLDRVYEQQNILKLDIKHNFREDS